MTFGLVARALVDRLPQAEISLVRPDLSLARSNLRACHEINSSVSFFSRRILEHEMSGRPNGPGERSPGLRPKADALGQQAPQPCGGLKGRENRELSRLRRNLSRPYRPRWFDRLSTTQGIGLRPQPWALFSRPVGPESPRLFRDRPLARFGVSFRGPSWPCGRATSAAAERLHVRRRRLDEGGRGVLSSLDSL